ncbi:MAG: hypothetical protein H8Z69_05835 [Nanohaloarchaea archaeon]|nr:hypothetical protein [Candidatus Nanohaloarchaea archaeon]
MSGKGPQAEEYMEKKDSKFPEDDEGEPIPVKRRRGGFEFDSVPETPETKPSKDESIEESQEDSIENYKDELMEPLYQTLFTGGLDVMRLSAESELEEYSNPVIDYKQGCLNELGLMEGDELTSKGQLVYDNWASKIEKLGSEKRCNEILEDFKDEEMVEVLNEALDENLSLHKYLRKNEASTIGKFKREHDSEAEFYEMASLFFDDGHRLEEIQSHEYGDELESRLSNAGLRGVIGEDGFNYEGGLIRGGVRLDRLNL